MLTLSPLDQQRFGFPVAKGLLLEHADGAAVVAKARSLGARLAIVRLPTTLLATAQSLEASGAILCDTLVHYVKRFKAAPDAGVPAGYACSAATPADADEVAALSRATFANYFGHYHSDARLDRALCDEIYSSWAGHSCRDPEFADHVLLVRGPARDLAAFATIKRISDQRCQGVLYGVSSAHQKRGLYAFLVNEAARWSISQGAPEFLYSTQLTNLGVQKVYCRSGFEPIEYFYTFHLWLDD